MDHQVVAYVVGLIISASLALVVLLLWMRQRSKEQENSRMHRIEHRRQMRTIARVAALEDEHRRLRLVEEALRLWGPRGDAE